MANRPPFATLNHFAGDLGILRVQSLESHTSRGLVLEGAGMHHWIGPDRHARWSLDAERQPDQRILDLSDRTIAVIGLGYVGLPLAVEFGKIRPVIGFDLQKARITQLE